MQFYRYLTIKSLKLLVMKKYTELNCGLFYQDRKLLNKRCTKIFDLIDYFHSFFKDQVWFSILYVSFVTIYKLLIEIIVCYFTFNNK